MKRFLLGLPVLFTTATLLAQSSSSTPTEISDETAAGIAAAVGGCGLIGSLISIALWLFVAIWIMKDAKRRNSPNATLVIVLGWLVWPIGLIVHLITRPKTISNP